MLRNDTTSARFRLALAALLFATLPFAAHAQAPVWPPKLVRIIVPFGAGASPDIVGRVLADSLQTRHPGTNFVVENKPGASGNIGTDAIAKSTPDGSTIGISLGGPLAINTLLFAKLPYNPDTDIAPITLLTQLPSVLAVPTSLGVNTVAEFLAKAKADPKGLGYGSIGVGTLSQLCMEAIAQKAGANMVHIPYPSSPAATTALIRGDVQVACLPAIGVTPQLATGAVKILAVTTAKRSPFLPDVPTLTESGIDVQSDAWNALVGPGGLSKDVVATINAEVTQTLAEPAVIEKLKLQLITPSPTTPDQLRKRMADEKALWAEVIKAAKIRID
ncbi:tripartite tricarboxylate transporter substrate binding protein [Tardiphaga sp. OK245]|jgi:tripartite-type tricarboxylate transporter receptor subunit TctC|uniref:Bug family tripartite tricarboxylate transporter substrate binding protein n=1 Tax=Tardiphaga sp. OK245 TaxID=1855306 RepID=UPI0008A77CE9|nr:tripartite tricarboxylate transporter substrate binding protein [Tardiphaga sp. OK245]SEH96469.1 Tripartite-type tricarboxylate transporter, receptor component TctC [Tardiphaga sp. OK245]